MKKMVFLFMCAWAWVQTSPKILGLTKMDFHVFAQPHMNKNIIFFISLVVLILRGVLDVQLIVGLNDSQMNSKEQEITLL